MLVLTEVAVDSRQKAGGLSLLNCMSAPGWTVLHNHLLECSCLTTDDTFIWQDESAGKQPRQ